MKKLAFIFFLLQAAVFAGVTGKISGVITDAGSGEELIGANVIIEGTSFGSATGVNGRYVILNIPPGIYSVKVSYLG